jgi:succinoglycan biosynthesis protein ExoW
MIRALTAGFDFCFTDNRRIGFYESYLREYASQTDRYLARAETKDGFTVIAPDEFLMLMFKEFPAHISTVGYRRCIAPDLRFDTNFKAAGEDILFLSMVVSKSGYVAFDRFNCVECGKGLNMYYGNLSLDSPVHLAICVDSLIVSKLINKHFKLSAECRRQNEMIIRYNGRRLAVQTAKSIVRFPNRVPRTIIELFKKDIAAAMLLPLQILGVGFTFLWRKYVNATHRAPDRR